MPRTKHTNPKREMRKKERAARRAKREAERKKPNYPRISLKSLWFTFRIYRKAAGPKRFFFWGYSLYTAVIPSITALLVGEATNQILYAVNTQDFIPFLIIAIIVLIIQLVNTLLREINSVLSVTVWQEVYIYVAEQIANKYIKIPLATRESTEFADKFNRVSEFGSSIAYVSTNLINMVASIISLIAVIASTLTISPLVAVIVIVSAIPYSILSLRLAAKHRRNWREFTKDRRVAMAIERKITNSNSALEIELNGLSKQLISKMVKERRRTQEKDIADIKSFFWPNISTHALDDIISVGILVFVAFEIMIKDFEIGAFYSVRTLSQQLNNSVSSLFSNLTSASEDLVNATDFMEFMNAPSAPTGDVKVEGIPKIEFRNVSFTYPRSNVKAVNNISFVLEPGESLAIVGENGAGKTTIIKLLIGAYQPSGGLILINDIPLERIDRESYLAQIGALFQDFSRYEFATLGENVWYGDTSKQYNNEAIRTALRYAGLDDLEKQYKNGLNQIMAKDFDPKIATDLSGGQWQRLGIARAFFRSPNILILDEPTSAVDAKSEYEIFQNIIQQQKGKTTLIISHRFSTVRKAKRIIVLDRGKIIEDGTHEELIANKGLYKEMFELQAEGYN